MSIDNGNVIIILWNPKKLAICKIVETSTRKWNEIDNLAILGAKYGKNKHFERFMASTPWDRRG